ncbi:MAG: SEC-C domain-containing protein [Acidobacteria bacterium]|nr:SEC-C domain-containing protein [Acidobacteriota bacterium]
MPSPGRNQPCPCGSGSKYKHCCEQKDKQPFMSQTGLIMGLAVAVVLAGGVAAFFNDSSSGADDSSTAGKVWSAEHGHYHDGPSGPASAPQPGQSAAAAVPAESSQTAPAPAPAGNAPASRPPGPAPAGKVWSSEHGHWHDAPSVKVEASQQGGLTGSASPGQPRPGMVWNEEHGHYHETDQSAPPAAGEAAPAASQDAPTTPVPRSQIPRISVGLDGVTRTASDIPQPPGPAPEGKVWSREHGHWHDKPAFPSGDFPEDASGNSGNSSKEKPQ